MRLPLLFVLVLAACGRAPVEPVVPPPPDVPPTWSHDVQPLISERCGGCHLAGGIAPFALGTYAEALKMKDAMRAAIETRRMPPWLAGGDCASYVDEQRLSDAQVAMFGKWVDTGALEGTPDQVTQHVDTPADGLTRVDLTLQMKEPFTASLSPDEYRCFVLDWPSQTDKYAVGMRVVPGNPKVVHHAIAFVIPPDQAAAVEQLDAAAAGPGYPCFGGPGTGTSRLSWLGAWAPGGRGSMYPPDTGMLVAAGSKVVLQVHYNVLAAPVGEREDLTQIEVATADTVKRKAAILLWTNPDWIRKQTMSIPAFAKNTTYSFAYDPTPYMGVLTNGAVGSQKAFRIYSASIHQHLRGTTSRLEVLHDNKPTECLLDIPRWDFHWQRSYGFSTTKIFRPGDRLNISCSWDNSAEAQPVIDGQKVLPQALNWGESTTDEMCLGMMYVTE